jgi:hypothetical protein
LFLNALITLVAAHFMAWPPILVVPFVWLLTAGGSVVFTALLLRVPMLSRLVGRARPLPDRAVLAARWSKGMSLFLRTTGGQATRGTQGKEERLAGNSQASEQRVDSARLEAVESGAAALASKKQGA